ncbi:ankyrin repeat containing protein [Grosmannia clavigera kw1407]|uniref:Ankyrin repeat containing protein n=1 Tax=Grosmannia clavigera (strain kw1407 / UAMH 11150) TaxID=655863 RepID=F0X6Y2_GROCL|nr:ankyrin repeat containing protein [Grosmannia clavigera kw1407]EFX06358.1 ankyrin repeat containing protein [Grosmannia clavigera kw1407]
MAPPNPAARDSEGAGGKGGNVPGRIGRPPQWTSTRSRKLARLYMYTTLSVDKILKVLEDDVFKPRKNSAQKTIHNMLDHDPRYLRPESREDMNQRIKLLSASTQRTRKSARDRDDYFPHPPDPSSMHQQPYADFYHPQYQQQAPPPSQHHALSMQSMTHHVPAYVGGSWPGFYPTHPVGTSAADVEAATRMTISSAPFDLSQHSPAALATAGIHHHGGHHGGHHELGVSLDGSSPTNGMGLPLYAQQQQQQQRERRSSTGACSTASSDVSTETIQDLKKRLSGCSTHYANQVSNLLRRFTISVDSDEAGVPVFEPDTDPHRVRKHRRKNNNMNSSSNKNHSSGTSNGRKKARSGSVSSDSSAVSNSCASESDGEYDGTFGPGRSSSSGGGGFHSHSHSTSMSTGDSSDASGQMRDDERKQQLWPTQGNLPVFLGACGDGVGSPRLALPGDFFNAYRYRNEACPHHRRQQQQKQQQQQQGDGLGGMPQPMGIHGSRLGGRDKKKSRERRYWCAVTEAVSAAAVDNGSFWVLGDGRLAPEAQALLHETAPHSMGRRDRFGHTLLHLFAAREGVQMQLLAMVLNSDDDSIVAANTAGQTFLHLLAPGWFVGLHEPYAPLLQLLTHLRDRRGSSSSMGDDGSAAAALAAAAASASGSSAVSPAHLVYATDVYGRSFFHRLQMFVDDPVILAGIAQHYERAALSRRDAFNNLPLMGGSSGGGGSSLDGSDSGGGVVMLDDVVPPWQSSPPAEGSGGALGSSSRSPTPRSGTATAAATGDGIDVDEGISSVIFASEDAFIRHHESLLRIVTASDSHPSMEDPEGRNGLHCLAQAIVDKRMMDEHRNAISTGRRPPKKKTMDKRGPDLLSPGSSSSTAATSLGTTASTTTALSTAPSLSTTPTNSMFLGSPMGALGGLGSIGGIGGIGSLGGLGGATSSANLLHTSADGPQMATRLRLVQGLLSPPTVVDVNHYDRRGQTVLTSFVVHIADDQEDKAKSLAAILETLLAAGARIDGRNRRGETALLVAARLGRKIALTTLLDHGANVHVRDAAGRGVLDIIDAQCRQRARHDVALYGRLEACRVLLTSIKQLPLGVCQRPTLLDEWTVASSRRGPEPRDMTMVM